MNTGEAIPTRVGHAGWDDHRHFGRWVFKDLAGRISTTGLIVLAATGEVMDEESCRVLDDVAAILTVGDPRIYPLKLVRLASAYGDPLAGLAASMAAMEGAIVGPRISQEAAFWLREVMSTLENRVEDRDRISSVMDRMLEERGRLSGFGVPFRKVDERRTALAERVVARRREEGAFWKLQEGIASSVLESRGLAANVGLSVAALSLDLGLRAERLAALYTGLTVNVFLANAVEGAGQAPSVLRKLPDHSIEYRGTGPRHTSDARTRP